eukprot:SAG31_NODE_805_length_11970_cov_3.710793_7_plen_135_part_00
MIAPEREFGQPPFKSLAIRAIRGQDRAVHVRFRRKEADEQMQQVDAEGVGDNVEPADVIYPDSVEEHHHCGRNPSSCAMGSRLVLEYLDTLVNLRHELVEGGGTLSRSCVLHLRPGSCSSKRQARSHAERACAV